MVTIAKKSSNVGWFWREGRDRRRENIGGIMETGSDDKEERSEGMVGKCEEKK